MTTEITCEVLGKLGVLSESPAGWTKEVRLMRWNGLDPCYDIREWAPGDRRITRGITLSLDELLVLQKMLGELALPIKHEEEATCEILAGAAGCF